MIRNAQNALFCPYVEEAVLLIEKLSYQVKKSHSALI